ncbi:hypothetical protein C1H46_013709 [Malus baccata]|uniref:Uncharacterized protein n=1 Tax=Malus baccata TaxID=106549 RepID=A0A540MQM0_MALBA|nr:hypothetical protein C1H46_013709 [Malus baccata]
MTHYNSKLPRIEGGRDQYFDHALLDCGIFVIHYAQVQEGKFIEPTFNKEEVFQKTG